MTDAGYTLVEMLAALAILGLALGGMAESAHALRMLQTGAATDLSVEDGRARAMRGLERVFDGQGPFRSDDPGGLAGGAAALHFDCGAAAPCTAQLTRSAGAQQLLVRDRRGWSDAVRLPGLGEAHFVYGDQQGSSEAWPPKPGRRRTLQTVALVSNTRRITMPVVVARLWREQAATCAFDPIVGDCREPDPR